MMLSATRASMVIGLLLAVAFAGCTSDDQGPNNPPKADLQVAQEGGNAFILDGTKSADPDGDQLTFNWNWVLGNATTHEPKLKVEFPDTVAKGNAGFVASLVVRDPDGKSSVAFGAIQFGTGTDNLPDVAIAPTARWVKPGTEIVLDASPTTDKDRDPLSFEWLWGPRGSYVANTPGLANACDETSTNLATFSTGCLNEGQSFKMTFSESGTWEIHCHPHPWMTSRIIVDETMDAKDTTLDIANFAYADPNLRVGKGSTVTFVNKDSVPHTATVLYWLAGTTEGGNNAVLKITPPEGEYVARVIVEDGKGATTTMSYGLKVSADAPENPVVKEAASEAPLGPQEAKQDARVPYDLSYGGLLTATFTAPDPSGTGTVKGNFSIGTVDDEDVFNPESKCVAKPDPAQAGTLKMTCQLPAGKYFFRITAGSVLPSWTLTASTMMNTKPDFGDSTKCTMHAGHCH